MKARVWHRLLLFGVTSRRLDAVLTAAVAALLAWSRFGLLADGPWEWDETLFARGILHFELAAHFPHPPGFPGWLAIGHILTPLTGDPLRALQLASAAFSVAALWVLSSLGRRVAQPAVATAAALVVLAAPGPWLYAVRGFSTTAASVLALAAAALLAGRLEGFKATAFTLLVTAAVLVRPILLPVLVVLWLAGASTVSPARRLLPGVAGGLAAGVASVLLMIRAEGGLAAFVAPFLAHSQRHFSRLVGNPGGFPDLGLVTGLGGVGPAILLVAAAAFGLVAWARGFGKRSVALWLTVLALSVGQLVWLQNRTYGRYAVGVQMALAPLVAGAASGLAPVAACTGLLGVAVWFGASSLPLLVEQHSSQLPAWRAVTEARAGALIGGRTVVLEPELYPFASYLWHLSERRGQANPPWVLSPWAPEPWTGVAGPWLVATVHRQLYPGPLYGFERRLAGVSARLEPLTQHRFLEAWVLEDAPLPVGRWWPAETTAEGRRFMWAGPDAGLVLPPLAARAELGVAVRPAVGPEALTVEWNGVERAVVDGAGAESRLWLSPHGPAGIGVSSLHLKRAAAVVPGAGDTRPLSAQLFELRCVDPDRAWTGAVAFAWQRAALKVTVEGGHAAERFDDAGWGVWLAPHAVISLPAGRGEVRLRLWAPRPTPPRTELWLSGRLAGGPLELGPRPRDVVLAVRAGESVDGRVSLVLESEPYRPSDSGLPDRRELGVVLSELAFTPPGADLDGPGGRP